MHDGKIIDNTTIEEVQAWLERIKRIHPHTVMLYPIDRETPEKELIKLSKEELEKVKEKVEQLGIKTLIY